MAPFIPVIIIGVVISVVIAVVVYGKRAARRAAALKEAHPSEPWLWNPEWQSGILKSSGKTAMVVLGVFALMWNAMAIPIAIVAISQSYLKEHNKAALLVLVFPAAGLPLIFLWLREILKYRKYGSSRFEMAAVPGVVGGKLGGVIHVPAALRPEGGIQLQLRCLHLYTTGSGKNRHTNEDCIWEDTRMLVHTITDPRTGLTALPVLFAIPFDARETTAESGADHRIIWRLEASAKTPGIDFAVSFDVPIFRTPESRPDFVLDESILAPFEEKVTVDDLFRRHKLITEPGVQGTTIRFPAARHIGHAIGATVFLAVWSAAIVMMFRLGAPLFFPIIFGLFAVFIVYGVLCFWLQSSRIEIAGRTITIQRGMLGLAAAKVIPRAEAKRVRTEKGMQSGNQVFYRILLDTSSGRTLTLGDGILGHRDSERIANHILSLIRSA